MTARERVLGESCVSSDSGLTVGACWCAECGDVRREATRGRDIVAIYAVRVPKWFYGHDCEESNDE